MENHAHIGEGLHKYVDAILRGNNAVKASASTAITPGESTTTNAADGAMYAAVKTTEEAYAIYQKAYAHTGFLEVQAFTARRAFPVAGANVVISKRFPQGQHVIAQYVTDEIGMTPSLKLPAVSKALSEVPGNPHPYTTVDATVSHPDYVTMHYLNIPVFQDVVSLQNADLIPLSAAPDGMTSMTVDEIQPDL